MAEMVRFYGMISYSQWGMFRMHLGWMPDWFARGAFEPVDDDLWEYVD